MPTFIEVDRPALSIIVVTHNGLKMALATLRSAHRASGGLDVEWIVVDSGSSDGTPEAIEQAFPGLVVERVPNRGFAAGNNVGLRRARGRYVLLLNPDVEIVESDFGRLLQELEERPEVGIASVVHLGSDGGLQRSIRRFPSPVRDLGEALSVTRWPLLRMLQEREVRDEPYWREHSVDWLVGAFLIARREAVDQVGLMDERFFLYCEEIDWCYRFRRAGWDVRHLPVMKIVHHAGGRDRGDLMAQLAYSRRLFAQKHFGPATSVGIRAALVMGHLLRLLVLAPRQLASGSARFQAERHALLVQLGFAAPPRLGADASA